MADSLNIPLFSAFILGLIIAMSPCPLALNITATAYLSKDISDKRRVLFNGVFYTFGNMFSYTVLASIIFFGASKLHVAQWFQRIDGVWIGIALVIFGILMLDIVKFNIPLLNKLTAFANKKNVKRNYLNAFLLGVVFALAFCPYTAVLYFGGLVPLMLVSSEGLLLPSVFSVAASLPVIITAWLLAYSVAGIGKFYNQMKSVEIWFKRIVATVFIVAGIYYIIINM